MARRRHLPGSFTDFAAQLALIFRRASTRRHHPGHAPRCPAHRPPQRRRPGDGGQRFQRRPASRHLGGKGWEWVSCGLLGGLYLLQQRLITWHCCPRLSRHTGALRRRPPMPSPRLRGCAVPPRLRRQHDRRLLHRHRPGLRCHHAARQTTLAAGIGLLTWVIRSLVHLSRRYRLCGAADEYRRAADRHGHPTPVFGHKSGKEKRHERRCPGHRVRRPAQAHGGRHSRHRHRPR